MQTQWKIRDVKDASILDASGKLTLGRGSFGIRQKVLELISSGRKKILFNLDKVSLMDSSAVGEMLEANETAVSLGARIKLISSQKRIHDILSIARLHLVFEVFEDEASAVDSFGAIETKVRHHQAGAFAG